MDIKKILLQDDIFIDPNFLSPEASAFLKKITPYLQTKGILNRKIAEIFMTTWENFYTHNPKEIFKYITEVINLSIYQNNKAGKSLAWLGHYLIISVMLFCVENIPRFEEADLIIKQAVTAIIASPIEKFNKLTAVFMTSVVYASFYQCLPNLKKIKKLESKLIKLLQKSVWDGCADSLKVINYPTPIIAIIGKLLNKITLAPLTSTMIIWDSFWP
ncbi:hypothetical protein ACFL56_02535 [Candidatus Margulisiibacteriota bacterium]